MKIKPRKKWAKRKDRKPRRKTERERQMMMNKKRIRHETRKKRKEKGQSTWSHVLKDWVPNIQAMYRKRKVKTVDKKSKKEKK